MVDESCMFLKRAVERSIALDASSYGGQWRTWFFNVPKAKKIVQNKGKELDLE